MVLITSSDANTSIGSFCNFAIVVALPEIYFKSITDCEVKREMDTAEDQKEIRSKRNLHTYNPSEIDEEGELTEASTWIIKSTV